MQVVLLTPTAQLPTRGSELAAGFDLYSDNEEAQHIEFGIPVSISTGIAVKIPDDFVGFIKPRSGLAFNHGVDHMAGVIDADYTGEIKLLLTSHDEEGYLRVERGMRVAQLVLVPRYMLVVEQVDSLDDTERGEGGFGSTGIGAVEPIASQVNCNCTNSYKYKDECVICGEHWSIKQLGKPLVNVEMLEQLSENQGE